LDNSPIVLLNRAIALSKVRGPKQAIEELKKIENFPSILLNYLYYSTKAEFQIDLRQYNKAVTTLEKAIELAPLKSEKILLKEKLIYCREKIV
jgi:RNA polymerase sigma-70 factor (ECF subfamily)